MSETDFDVGIIGGGPAGSALASYLVRAGVPVVVFERELFPRPHVGESLVHACNRVLREIGVIERMDEIGFPRKYGAEWTSPFDSRGYSHDWKELTVSGADSSALGEAAIAFAERAEFDPLPYTWHVDRGLFDNMLLQHAAGLGAQVYEGISVSRVELGENGAPHRICYKMGKQELGCTVKIVVDASGRRTFLGNQLRIKVKDKVFDQFAIHTWFKDYSRGESSTRDYIKIHFLPISNSWVWQIPITDTITSFGVVTQRSNFPSKEKDRAEFFWECVQSRPDIYENLRAAEQMRPFTPEGDYSYAMKQFTGDGWLLIGDAARFVDPIFSSGVSIALNSARFAQRDILEALEAGDTSRSAFRRYETILTQGCSIWYRFINLYYRLNVLFTWFINEPVTRLQMLRILQGDVYDESEVPVLEQMSRMIAEIEANPNHVLHRYLGSLTALAFKPEGRPSEQETAPGSS